jgi:hypothetical protein
VNAVPRLAVDDRVVLAGDALGSAVEFRTAADIARDHPRGVTTLTDGGTWNLIAGQPTDDSEMALALARSLVARGGFKPGSASLSCTPPNRPNSVAAVLCQERGDLRYAAGQGLRCRLASDKRRRGRWNATT